VRRRLLLIDDDDDIRVIARVAIEAADGWTVTTASDGETGVALAADGAFDAVVVDLMMPGLDGEATIRRLRAQPATQQTPIVLMTASPEIVDWDDELGVAGIVRKPFDAISLPADIGRLCGW
jgi:two-component system alkaline phosphatase synthesis response regulator PhoP